MAFFPTVTQDYWLTFLVVAAIFLFLYRQQTKEEKVITSPDFKRFQRSFISIYFLINFAETCIFPLFIPLVEDHPEFDSHAPTFFIF